MNVSLSKLFMSYKASLLEETMEHKKKPNYYPRKNPKNVKKNPKRNP
jgi:hypothetical protein